MCCYGRAWFDFRHMCACVAGSLHEDFWWRCNLKHCNNALGFLSAGSPKLMVHKLCLVEGLWLLVHVFVDLHKLVSVFSLPHVINFCDMFLLTLKLVRLLDISIWTSRAVGHVVFLIETLSVYVWRDLQQTHVLELLQPRRKKEGAEDGGRMKC